MGHDMLSGREIFDLNNAHISNISALAWREEGCELISGDVDGLLLRWKPKSIRRNNAAATNATETNESLIDDDDDGNGSDWSTD